MAGKFTKEQIEKAAKCKSAEELFELAKAEGEDITKEEAEKYYAQLFPEPTPGGGSGSDTGNCSNQACTINC